MPRIGCSKAWRYTLGLSRTNLRHFVRIDLRSSSDAHLAALLGFGAEYYAFVDPILHLRSRSDHHVPSRGISPPFPECRFPTHRVLM